jgi:hypothetical protein
MQYGGRSLRNLESAGRYIVCLVSMHRTSTAPGRLHPRRNHHEGIGGSLQTSRMLAQTLLIQSTAMMLRHTVLIRRVFWPVPFLSSIGARP